MARYIDADALLEKMKKTNRYFDVKFDIEEMPTANVAPRADVAREIFEEIEKLLCLHYDAEEYADYPSPHYEANLKKDIADLKKKYESEG